MPTIPPFSRRGFLAAAGASLLPGTLDAAARLGPSAAPPERPRLKLGLVTYNLARSWTLDQVIENCTQSKVEAVELRTTHAHGVEVTLSAEHRKEIKRRFESSPVRLASLGSAFEFQSPDPAELRKNIEGAKEYARLAADVGAAGFKVRPNGFPPRGAVPEETTLRQIGQALAEVGTAAAAVGVEVRVEVHGNGTCRLPNIRKILDHAAHSNVYVCWNSNAEDLLDGGLESNFALVRDKIRFVHLRDLFEDYPFPKLFSLLRDANYSGYCCAEIPESTDPVRVLKYFRALFLADQDCA